MSVVPGSVSVLVVLASVVGIGGVLSILWARPEYSAKRLLSFAPWVAVAATGYAGAQSLGIDESEAAVLYPPTVYVGTLGGAAMLLAVTDRLEPRLPSKPSTLSAGTGSVVLVATLTAVRGTAERSFSVTWPLIALFLSVIVTLAVWRLLSTWSPDSTTTGLLGGVALFGQVLDGVTTTVGIDILGFSERVPLSRAVLQFAGALPTADYIGVGWLFVLVKIALATLLVKYLASEARENPMQACLMLGVLAAVGLGPDVHNLVLYATS